MMMTSGLHDSVAFRPFSFGLSPAALCKAGTIQRLNAYVAQMATPPSVQRQADYAEFFAIAASVLDKMDVAYITAGHDVSVRDLNIINPEQFALQPVGSPIFDVDTGFASKSASQYLDTGFIPEQHATKATLLNTEMGVFVLDNSFDPASSSPAECGSTYTMIKALEHSLITGAPTTVGGRVNRAATFRSVSGAVTTAIGMTSVVRTRTISTYLYRNGQTTHVGAAGGAAVQMDNASLRIGGATGGSYSPRKIGFFYYGAALSIAERKLLYDALVVLLTKIGAYNAALLNEPPNVGGPDPYAPGPQYVWTEAYAGTPLDLTGYVLTMDETFQDLSVIKKSGTGATGTWFSPVRTWGFTQGTFAQIDDPWEPIKLDPAEGGKLRLRMAHDGVKWRGVHLQTSESDGRGFSQTRGYFEYRLKTPPAGTKGAWPAGWLYATGLYNAPPGSSSLTRPEVDTVELYPGHDTRGHHTALHLRPGSPYVLGQVSKYWGKSFYTGMDTTNDGQWHTYGSKITDEWIITYRDGIEIGRMKTHPDFLVSMHMLISLQLVNDEIVEMDTAVPVDMWVDYARAYQAA